MSTFIGIDLGGTKVAAAVLRAGAPATGGEGGTLSPAIQYPTVLDSADALLDQLGSLIEEARDGAGAGELDAVGIGVPSVVDFASGRVVHSVNIPLEDVPLRTVLGARLGVPVFVDNDATVAALAEAHDEQLRLVARDLVMLTIGTGVGGGLVLGGRIYRGATGGAAEIGHTLISLPVAPAGDAVTGFPADLPDDFPSAGTVMPHPGSLEALGSGHALDHLARAAGLGAHGADVTAAARAGAEPALALIRRWAHAIGIGIANAINIFDPQEVVVGGGAAAAADLFLEPALAFAAGYVHPGLRGHATVRVARFGAEAGVMGAALLAAHEYRDAPPANPAGGA
ncbi:ROK family protein [Conexibacter sp. DBS9H8]|uniref:ROK family protein n=1 Tax=Conexibacter sp. DBS9H8 TaxID=2937801 RepID=UPI00200D48C5|nr:ROK family protein [Conexibacter sp. DBS9H8]